MEIALNSKITLQPACLLQGESHATTLAFSLPRESAGCRLDELSWQVRCTNQSTLAFMADALLPKDAPDKARFLLPWRVSAAFTRQSGALALTLAGSSGAGDNATLALFRVEGVEVAPVTHGDGEAPPPADYLELALLQTGQNAARALESKALAETHARDARACAQEAAESAKAAAASAGGMDPGVYDPAGAGLDIFALLNGMPPVYEGASLRLAIGAGRVAGVCLPGRTRRAGSGAPTLQNPRPLQGVESADVVVNGRELALALAGPLFAAGNTRTGETVEDVRHLAGEETRHLALKTFTGAENFTRWGNQNGTTEWATDPISVLSLPSNDDMPTALCSHFAAPLTPNQIWSASVPAFSASHRLFLRTAHKTAAEFKAWLAAQHAAGTPVQVLYRLPQPNTTQNEDTLPTLPEGLNTFAPKDKNALVRVTLKRVYEA